MSTRWRIRTASQTTYGIHELPGEIRVTYRPHPLFGRRLKVMRRRRVDSELQWIVALPNGSHASIPSSWTDQAVSQDQRVEPPASRASPSALRDLLGLLDALLEPPPPLESRSVDPTGGNRNERATSSVRARPGELGRACMDKGRHRATPRDHSASGGDGQVRTRGTTKATRGGDGQ